MARGTAGGLALFVVVAVVVAPLVAGVTPAGEVEFGRDTDIVDQRGDVVRIPITFETGSLATLEVFGPGYDATLVVNDDDGDGQVTVLFDTYRPGDPSRAFSTVDDDDQVDDRHLFRMDGTAPTGTYRLRVSTDDSRDRMLLRLRERSTGDLTALGAPGAAADTLDGPAAVAAARENRTVTAVGGNRTVARGDLFVVAIGGSGFGSALSATETDALSLRLARTGECAGTADLLAAGTADVLTEPGREDYYAVVDTAAVELRPANATAGFADGCSPALRPGDRVRVDLTVPARSPLAVDGRATAETGPVTVVERTAAFDGVALAAAANQSVTGNTTLAPGTALSVAVQGPDVERTATVRVGVDGRFDATVDLSGVERFANVTLHVRADGSSLLDAPRRAVVGADTPAVSFADQSGAVDSVTVDLASLPDGGFVVLRSEGSVVGVSPYREGVVTGLSVPVEAGSVGTGSRPVTAFAYRDANGNERFDGGDEPYLSANDETVARSASVSFQAPTTTTTPGGTNDTNTTTTTPAGGGATAGAGGTTGTNVGLAVVFLILFGPVVLALREG